MRLRDKSNNKNNRKKDGQMLQKNITKKLQTYLK